MNADVRSVEVHSPRIWLLALVLAIVTLLAPIVADITLDLGVVPAAMADGPQHGGGG